MRTFNVRLAAILLALTVVFGGGVYFLHGYQVKRNAYVFLDEADKAQDRAKEAAKDKNPQKEQKAYQDIAKNLGWYIRLNPDDVDVLQRLGLLLADRAQDGGTAGQAFSKLESVLRLDPDRKDVRRRLVDVALMIGRFSDAREHLRDFLLKQSPDDPELLELMGRCQAAMSDEGQAVETFKKVIEFAPKQVDAYPRLAGVLRYQLSRPKEADQWMEKLVKVNPDSFKAHLLRGSYLKNIDANDEALKESLIALKLAPKEGDELRDALWLAAQCSAAKEKYDDARNYAQQGIKLFPGNVVLYTTLADVELRSGQREKAVEVLDQGLKATHDDPQLLWAKANLLIDTNKIPEAQKTIADLQATGYPKGLIEYLLARIELVQGRWLPARVGFENARGTLTMWPNLLKQVDFWIGQCYGQLNNNDQQLAAYRRALKLDPFYTPARNGLIEALMASGQLDDALNEYSDLAKMGKVSSAGLIPWARMLILRNLRVDPAARNWEPVNKLLDEAEKATPESSQIPVLRAEILVAQDRAEDAGKLLADVREKDPKKAEIWSVMASLAQRQGNWDAAEKVLDEAEKASGDTVDVRVARAQYLIRRYAADAKDRVRALAENTAKWTDAQRLQLCGGLLSAALQIDDTEFAKKLCRQIADKEPNNVQVRVLMFEQALRAENDAELEQTLKEIERVAGRGSFWLYGQAVRLSLKAKNDNEKSDELQAQALRYLAQAQELRTNWSRIPLLMGSIYDQQGKTNQALRNYQDAIDLGERNPGAIRRAVQLLFQKQQYADADKLLRQLERQQMPFSPELNRAGAEVALRQGDYNRALALAKKTAAEDSKDYQSHLWLGQMLGVLSSQAKAQGAQKEADELMAEAEKSLRRAVEVEPKNAATWVSLIQFLAANDRASEAEKGIEEAQKDIPEKQAALALAQCYEAVKKPDDAQKSYEAALSATPKDPFVVRAVADFYYRNSKPIPAEALLRRIIDGKVDAQESDVIWARRQLASIFASRGGYQNIQKARTLIEENLTAAEGSAYDRRAKVTLDAADPLRSRRDQAIQGLEKLIESQVATPDDCLNLAQMYLAVGDWQKASNLLRDLVAKHGGEPRFLAAYIRALLDHKETTTAQTYLRKLERIAPTHYVTVSLNAEVLFLKKDYEKSRDVMKHFLDDNDSQPADRNVRLRLVAETLEQFGRRLTKASDKTIADRYEAQAEMLYRSYVDQNRGQEMLLVAFLGRQGRIDDAIDMLDRSWQDSNATVLAQVLSIIIKDGAVGKEQYERLDRIVQAALKAFDRPVPLLLSLADMRTAQTRYGDAETFYREVLEKNSGNAIAMNNLAVMLALQGVKLEEAKKLVDQAIEIAGPVAAMLDSRATVYVAIGKPEQALIDMEKALEDAKTPVRYFHQAQAYEEAGQHNAAAAAMKSAMELGLTKEMLQPLEIPAFEKLRQLAQ